MAKLHFSKERNEAPTGLDKPASAAQVKKLLVMLSENNLIESWWAHGLREYDEETAVAWVRENFAYEVEEIEDLTMRQIGTCYEELGD